MSATWSGKPKTTGWCATGDGPWSFVAPTRLVDPCLVIALPAPATCPCRIRFTLHSRRIETAEIAFRSASGHRREMWLNLFQPHLIDHPFAFCSVTADVDAGEYHLDLDLDLGSFGNDPVLYMEVRLADESTWRIHPWDLPRVLQSLPEAPVGARVAIHDLRIDGIDRARRGPAHGLLANPVPPRVSKAGRERRDAVVFAAGVPRRALHVGEHLLATLMRHHADSRIFAGLNRDCCPEFEAAVRSSGLDVVVRRSPASMRSNRDAAAFIAALDAFRDAGESFDLVWFGHTKGAGHPDDRGYVRARWSMEKRFWSRRDVIDGYFADPRVGLYSPNYSAQWRGWTADADAAMRIAGLAVPPPAITAATTFYVMRDDHVRFFCDRAPETFFETGVEPFGGTFYFFEWGLPNLPLALGVEAVVERGLGRTTLPTTRTLGAALVGDERQTQAIVRRQLEAYRRVPASFEPPLPEAPLWGEDIDRLVTAQSIRGGGNRG